MGCPHCMDNSTPDGGIMDDITFENAVRFAHDCSCSHVLISGGEPTEHPRFVDCCKRVSESKMKFSICTNGMWLGDEKGEYRFEKVARMKGFVAAQVYSNKKWYRLYDEIVTRFKAQEQRWTSLNVNLDTEDIRNMIDLGRAKNCEAALKEVQSSKYHNSCLAAHVTAVQSPFMGRFVFLMSNQGRFCTPMIDWLGNVHASESWLCQSFGNVNRDDRDTVFENLKKGRPCGKCLSCQKYLTEDSEKMKMARQLLGQGEFSKEKK